MSEQNQDIKDVEEMNQLFRNADFTKENPEFQEKLLKKIQGTGKVTAFPGIGAQELSEDDLENVAAAKFYPIRPR